jgi:hypothetical protein
MLIKVRCGRGFSPWRPHLYACAQSLAGGADLFLAPRQPAPQRDVVLQAMAAKAPAGEDAAVMSE